MSVQRMDVEEPNTIKHALFSRPKVFSTFAVWWMAKGKDFSTPSRSCYGDIIWYQTSYCTTPIRHVGPSHNGSILKPIGIIIIIPFIIWILIIIPFILVYNCHPTNKSEPRWKHSDHCLWRWNCLEVNLELSANTIFLFHNYQTHSLITRGDFKKSLLDFVNSHLTWLSRSVTICHW